MLVTCMMSRRTEMRERDAGDGDVGVLYSDLGDDALDKACLWAARGRCSCSCIRDRHVATAALVCQAIGCVLG